MARIYLDHNATTPLRPEARAAMAEAMDLVGNPSSVHAEGRAAKMALERARAEVLSALGADGADLVWTSGATEAAALAMAGRGLDCAAIEHDAVLAWGNAALAVDRGGAVTVDDPARTALQLANSETGVVQNLPDGLFLSDVTQGFGKRPFAFNWSGASAAIVSAHKLGGPKGIGALILRKGTDIEAQIKGGGQEQGRRAGTENLIGALGFAAAAAAAQRDLEAGRWDALAALRDRLEALILDAAPGTIIVGRESDRLPNTLCLLTSGWKGETQVMQMDLAGIAVSAGSACSSGKVRSSQVLRAMGFSDSDAGCAIRVSLGPLTTEAEIDAFARAWLTARARWSERNRAGQPAER
ncbi:MAG: aminotransferase class V-fold PLP-dependent enzyme [Paracoccus sp. (in: a-proteobacteria)]|nr:aminotransferase class V-fold PLP-dependent enzyme [Paracoccus sp. (in: a-proteobacteria)]